MSEAKRIGSNAKSAAERILGVKCWVEQEVFAGKSPAFQSMQIPSQNLSPTRM